MVQTHTDVPNQQVYFEKINELANFFALTKGFGIVFCIADNFFFRKEVNRQIIERLADKDIIITDFLLEEENNIAVVEQLKKLKLTNQETKGIIINNFDFLLANQSNALSAFNQSRDVLSKLEIPLLFWLSEENIRSLSKSAPDIYTFRSLPILEFKAIPDFQSESFLIPRFSEDYRTTADYEQIRLKIELLERQLEEAESQGYPKKKIIDQIVIPLFHSYDTIRLFEQGAKLFNQYESFLDKKNTKHLSIELFFYENDNQLREALHVGQEIKKIEEKENQLHSLIYTNYNIGRIYFKLKLYNKSLEFLFKSKEAIENINAQENNFLPWVYNEIAISYRSNKNYDLAEEYQIKALDTFHKVKNQKKVNYGSLYNNLALIYLGKGKIEDAEKYQIEAIGYTEKYLDDYNLDLANCYHNYAAILQFKKNYQKAFFFEKKAFKILKFGKYYHLPIFKQVCEYIDWWKIASGALLNKKTGRNASCPCGSKKKYKNCCLNKKEKTLSVISKEIIISNKISK